MGNLVVTKCGYACYYEYGTTAYAKVTEGKVVAKTDGEITVLYAVDNKVAAQEDGGKIGVAYCTGTASEYDTFSNDKGGNVVFDGTKSATEIDTAGNAVVSNKIDAQVQEETVGAVVRVGTKGYEKFSDALDAAAEIGGTVTLLEDTYCYGPQVAQGKNVTLDLNGKKLHVGVTVNNDSSISDSCVKVNYGATLTIKDSVGTGKIWSNSANTNKKQPVISCQYGGTLIVESGTVESINFNAIEGTNATITVKGGTITGKTGGISTTGTLNINGGTINGAAGVKVSSGTATFTGGTINATSSAITLSSSVTAIISNGSFNGTISATGTSTLTITGGSFINEESYMGSLYVGELDGLTTSYVIVDSDSTKTYCKYVMNSYPYYLRKEIVDNSVKNHTLYYQSSGNLSSMSVYNAVNDYSATVFEENGNSDIKDIYNLPVVASGYHYERNSTTNAIDVVADN